jgi:multidrug efflux pump subunit AcrA (membrane-fusion protein)
MATKSHHLADSFDVGHAWQELEDVMEELGLAARSAPEPDRFYAQLVAQLVESLAAHGGAAWVSGPDNAMRLAAQLRFPLGLGSSDEAIRREHQILLAELATHSAAVRTCCAPITLPPVDGAAVRMLVGTVPQIQFDAEAFGDSAPQLPADRPAFGETLAIIELVVAADVGPAVYQGQLRFLAAVCEIAAEYHAFRELGQLRSDKHNQRQLLELSRRLQQVVGLRPAACELANEGARVIGCDRLSVAIPHGRRCRLIATNGVHRLTRRASAVRRLECLATVAYKFNEPIQYAGDTGDCPPQIAELLEQYADESHARQVAILPIALPPVDESSDQSPAHPRQCDRPLAVLIAEQFDAHSDALLERTTEVAVLAAPALAQATRWDRLPLRWLLEPLGRLRDLLLPRNLAITVATIGAVAALVATLVLVPADFTVEATGTLEPAVRRHVFASRSGLVDDVLVRHGDTVTEDQELVRLRDADLELEWKRIAGELDTVAKQLDAVRATKSGRAANDLTALESYRLSAEQRQHEQQLANLRRELELLEAERKSLVLHSPLAGKIITWDVDRLLAARPVDRGQVLLTVAELDALWQLELHVPDDRIGHVLAATQTDDSPLPVKFKLSSHERDEFAGQVETIAGLAEAPDTESSSTVPTVRVTVSFDKQSVVTAIGDELRPGLTARARIACGRRPLGYVWLHDIWDALVRWFTF